MKKTIILKLVLSLSLCSVLSSNAQDVKIDRFDKELYNYIKSPSEELSTSLMSKHLNLIDALSQTISSNSQKPALETLRSYFSHPALTNIYADVVKQYDDLSSYEKELASMAHRAKKELKINSTPNFSVHVSGFKENSIYINNTISLSIDKYMGKDYVPYRRYFRPYQLQQMQSQMIVKDFTRAWLMADYIKTETTQGDMLFEMIEHGKLIYALSILLPQHSENELMAYTNDELDWCTNNEKKAWESIVKQNHLYTTDKQVIYNYFNESPLSNKFLNGAPGQVGAWIGLQIVKQYAKNKKQNLLDIIRADYKSILKESKYKP